MQCFHKMHNFNEMRVKTEFTVVGVGIMMGGIGMGNWDSCCTRTCHSKSNLTTRHTRETLGHVVNLNAGVLWFECEISAISPCV